MCCLCCLCCCVVCVVLCCVVLCCVVLCCAVGVVLCCVVLCYVMLCCVVLLVLCCVALCYVMLCYVCGVLCCVVLHCVARWKPPCARGAGIHRDVSNVHTVTFWTDTRCEGRRGHRQFCLPKRCPHRVLTCSRGPTKKPLDLSHFQV